MAIIIIIITSCINNNYHYYTLLVLFTYIYIYIYKYTYIIYQDGADAGDRARQSEGVRREQARRLDKSYYV